jgi:hypothetical protein
LLRLRKQFNARPLTYRPSLDVPGNLAGLLTWKEIATLGRWNWWPLPPAVLAWIATDPAIRARRRRRFRAAVKAAVRRILGQHSGTTSAEGEGRN